MQFARPPSTADAHAVLLRSDPADSASLSQAPAQIRLWFSEALAGGLASVQLLDTDGHILSLTPPRVDATEAGLVVIDLPSLAGGAYSLNWTVVSETGGHPARGTLVFAIGSVAPPRSTSGSAFSLASLEAPLNGLLLTGLIGLLGALAMATLVLQPAARSVRLNTGQRTVVARAVRRTYGLAGVCAVVGFGAGALWLLWQLLSVANGPADVLSTAWLLVAQTRAGLLWLSRQALFGLVAVLLWRAVRGDTAAASPLLRAAAVAIATVLAVVQALSGHAAALSADALPLAIAADALHVLAGAAWVGGLLALTVGVVPVLPRDPPALTILSQVIWTRFSRVAGVSAGLVVASGLYAVGRQVVSLAALVDNDYGRLVLAKVGLVLATGAIGLVLSSIVHPRALGTLFRVLQRASLPRLTRIETYVGLAVVVVAGLLASAAPPRVTPNSSVPHPAYMSAHVADLLVGLEVRPNRAGPNVLMVRAISQRRPAPGPVEQVQVRLIPLAGGEPLLTDADLQEPGVFRVAGEALAYDGPWSAEIIVQRPGQPALTTTFGWTVGSTAPTTTRTEQVALASLLDPAAGLVVLVTIVVVLLFSRRRRHAPSAVQPRLAWSRQAPFAEATHEGAAR
ncbi:MAG TPA: copper resistance protein CopC [Chloroflexota bacterium]|nr:copper resistance protein CopC [Chloroflexota bacterium]